MAGVLLSIRNRCDRLGLLLSGLCAVHCGLSIGLVSALGLGGELLLAPAVHRVGLALALAIGVVSLGLGVMRHGRLGPLAIGATGIALMAGALAVGHGPGEVALTVPGVILVAVAHIRNLHQAR